MRQSVTAAIVATLCAISRLVAQTTNPLDLIKDATRSGERIAYGGNPLQFGELQVPAGPGPHPLAILVHGGCWMARVGQLPENVTSLELLRPMAAALVANGMATWNIEYRRVGNDGGGWPGTFDDVARATDFARELARTRSLDLNRVVIVGHSSGGHLAAWLAARHKLPPANPLRGSQPLRVAGIVAVDAPLDLESVIPIERQVCGEAVVARLVGGSPAEVPARYRESSATGLLPIGAKQELLIADKHNAEWIDAIKTYGATAKAAGDPVDIVMLKDSGHFDGINPKSEVFATVLASIRVVVGGK